MCNAPLLSRQNLPLLFHQREALGKYLWRGAWFGLPHMPAAPLLLESPSLRFLIANVQGGVGLLLAFCRDRIVCDPMPPKKERL
jgi:hypothetical protein